MRLHATATSKEAVDQLLAGNPTAGKLKARLESLDEVIYQVGWACQWPALIESLTYDRERIAAALAEKPLPKRTPTGHALALKRRKERALMSAPPEAIMAMGISQ